MSYEILFWILLILVVLGFFSGKSDPHPGGGYSPKGKPVDFSKLKPPTGGSATRYNSRDKS